MLEQISGPYIVTVDLSLTFDQMIEAGAYNLPGKHVSLTEECFPIERSKELIYKKELFLIPPSRDNLSTSEWKKELEENGWNLERIAELFALGAQYPDLQRDHCIIAFGSSYRTLSGWFHSPELWLSGGWLSGGVFPTDDEKEERRGLRTAYYSPTSKNWRRPPVAVRNEDTERGICKAYYYGPNEGWWRRQFIWSALVSRRVD